MPGPLSMPACRTWGTYYREHGFRDNLGPFAFTLYRDEWRKKHRHLSGKTKQQRRKGTHED